MQTPPSGHRAEPRLFCKDRRARSGPHVQTQRMGTRAPRGELTSEPSTLPSRELSPHAPPSCSPPPFPLSFPFLAPPTFFFPARLATGAPCPASSSPPPSTGPTPAPAVTSVSVTRPAAMQEGVQVHCSTSAHRHLLQRYINIPRSVQNSRTASHLPAPSPPA